MSVRKQTVRVPSRRIVVTEQEGHSEDSMSRFTTLINTTAVAFAAVAVVGLSAPPAATADPAPAGPATSAQVPVRTQGWLNIYAGRAPHGANAVELTAVADPAVGLRVTDGDGRSLYRFDKDTAKPSQSNCNGDCAVTWPPLLVSRGQGLYIVGIDPGRVGFVERADGSCQITVGGWPVYHFSKDHRPGDLRGQGVGGTWFAVAPSGGKALAK
jgi:predicted lipoprotein with Yx(FWY)xxD motif